MKLLFDENLSYRLVSRLADLCPESLHVRDVGLAGASDDLVWAHARDNGFLLYPKTQIFISVVFPTGLP